MGINTDVGFTDYRYYHVKHINHYTPALTFFFDVDQTATLLKFSFSVCNPKDNFSRHTGQNICNSRIANGFYFMCEYDRNVSLIHNAMRCILHYVSSHSKTTDPLLLLKYREGRRVLAAYDEIKTEMNWIDEEF